MSLLATKEETQLQKNVKEVLKNYGLKDQEINAACNEILMAVLKAVQEEEVKE